MEYRPLNLMVVKILFSRPYNLENRKFIEYVKFHGVYADIPVAVIVKAWERAYGKDHIKSWIKRFEEGGAAAFPTLKVKMCW